MRVKKPEAQLLSLVLDYLAVKRVLAFRQNSGAVLARHKGKQRMIRYGLPGMADVLAFPVYRDELGFYYTVPTWIELKAAQGKQSELQKSFQVQVELYGHKYVIARSIEEVEAGLR